MIRLTDEQRDALFDAAVQFHLTVIGLHEAGIPNEAIAALLCEVHDSLFELTEAEAEERRLAQAVNRGERGPELQQTGFDF
jgi:hypothetical protein